MIVESEQVNVNNQVNKIQVTTENEGRTNVFKTYC